MPKPVVVSTLLLLLILNACSKEEAPPPAEPEGPVAGASPRATLDRVKVSTDLSALRKAIQMYKTENEGALPPSLDTLDVSGLYYGEYYVYDASSGEVHCTELPDL